jgi:hypothetical protein
MTRRRKLAFAGSAAAIAALVGIGILSGNHPTDDNKAVTEAPAIRAAGGDAQGFDAYSNHVSAAVPINNPAKATPAVDLTDAKRSTAAIIHNADVTIQAKDVPTALRKASDLVTRAGGNVFSDTANFDTSDQVHIVFNVPPEQFDLVMSELGGVGKVLQSSTSTKDVTGEVVDLDARLAAARASADRVRALLAKTGSVNDLLGVEQALTEREANVDSLAAQVATLRAQVDFATITVDISPSPRPRKAPAAPHASHHIPGFLAGLRTGFAALVNGLLVVGTALGFALPFLFVGALVFVPVFLLRRRRQPEPAAA